MSPKDSRARRSMSPDRSASKRRSVSPDRSSSRLHHASTYQVYNVSFHILVHNYLFIYTYNVHLNLHIYHYYTLLNYCSQSRSVAVAKEPHSVSRGDYLKTEYTGFQIPPPLLRDNYASSSSSNLKKPKVTQPIVPHTLPHLEDRLDTLAPLEEVVCPTDDELMRQTNEAGLAHVLYLYIYIYIYICIYICM
jgi:hypothetical protein